MTHGGRHRTGQATQACMTCKTRKKKCNKSLPSCGYCIRSVNPAGPPSSSNPDQSHRKHLKCVFARVPNRAPSIAENPHNALNWNTRPPMSSISSGLILSIKSDLTTAELHQLSCPFQSNVYSKLSSSYRIASSDC
jgi:hypothetical protein